MVRMNDKRSKAPVVPDVEKEKGKGGIIFTLLTPIKRSLELSASNVL